MTTLRWKGALSRIGSDRVALFISLLLFALTFLSPLGLLSDVEIVLILGCRAVPHIRELIAELRRKIN